MPQQFEVKASLSAQNVIDLANRDFVPIRKKVTSYLKEIYRIDASNFRTLPLEIVDKTESLLRRSKPLISKANKVYIDYQIKVKAALAESKALKKNVVGFGEDYNDLVAQAEDKLEFIERHQGDIKVYLFLVRGFIKKISEKSKLFIDIALPDEKAAPLLKKSLTDELEFLPDLKEQVNKSLWISEILSNEESEEEKTKRLSKELGL